MPINFQQIHTRIQEIGRGARQRQQALDERRAKARDLLAACASELDSLRSKVDSVKSVDANIRCACPVDESLVSSHPAPAASDVVLIAADGSQIAPDRHAALQFGLINIGAISMKLHSGETPEILTDSELFYGDDLLPNGIPLSEDMLALKRDLSERIRLDDLSRSFPGQVITLTDGPIELWGAKGEDARAYADFINKYLTILSRLQSRGVITAGYVDKPAADLVIRLLEIATADNEKIKNLRDFHPLRGVSDRWLFGEPGQPLLPAGHRSAVFKLQSSSEKHYKGLLELHFFYLNAGTEKHPWIVRVEIPRWVADDGSALDLLHAVLVDQCRIMGSRPYPYLLHRAHETAVVHMEEKTQIEQLLSLELRRNEVEVDDPSNKQSAKDLPGRTRS